jgi:hypothetical protein
MELVIDGLPLLLLVSTSVSVRLWWVSVGLEVAGGGGCSCEG